MALFGRHPMHKWNALFHLCIFYVVKDITVDVFRAFPVILILLSFTYRKVGRRSFHEEAPGLSDDRIAA
ncbi:hypothetical protein GGQ95_003146 [Anoxybacillus rupiensis]|nr:hypothetical protein [Anoxybacillus rupiensis]